MVVADPTQITAEDARKHAGKWVAIKDGSVIYAADQPAAVIAWIRKTGVEANLVTALPAEGEPKVWLM